MPDRVAIARGIQFEEDVVATLGLQKSPGSGNIWSQKGDGQGAGIRVSAKSEIKRSWGDTRRQFKETVDMCASTGDLPVLCIEDPSDGERLVVMRLTDFSQFREQGGFPVRAPKRAEAVREASKIPALLRENLKNA